ncbi:mechanosensitive ion channel family protein [uncultured Alistipes sp.]|uniref:mechanosensitive ion channel family protein n=1 Tax=uncultured Alistipes sp. TaxID=538949 RepID=UPI002630C04A|nr:mechanosensitive ion channel domain-containing protein [uncultured Alistipes sp.]
MIWSLLAQAQPAAPLMLPDSVQKAKFAQAVDKLANLDLEEVMRNLLSQSIWILVKILVAVFIYLVGRWVLRRLLRLLDVVFERRNVDTSLRTFARNALAVIFSVILVLVVVQTLGVNVTSLIAVASAATLAIGMALSGTAQNFAGGVMILLMKPYRVGDFITAQGQSGTVHEIKLFSTVVKTGDNRTIYIPNNSIATAIVDNASTATQRRVDWSVSIAYGDDVEAARRTLLEILEADDRVLRDPAAVVRVASLAESAVSLTVRAWVRTDDYWDVFFDNNERFYRELPGKGLHFPFPQLDIHMPQK